MPLGPCHLEIQIAAIAFRSPNSVAAVPTVSSCRQRRVSTELFKDAGAPLKLISHSCGEGCVLQTLPGWVSRS